jgi:diaminohydroxyphosphoribosylaminopyrimidine deaminase/5-amino-6-(5-phosphoribosylamino)uracil reductase
MTSDWSADDYRFMARALRLAERGLTSADPNPRVGCVLVEDGNIVGEGWHRVAGGPHAEIAALTNAADAARGSTAYVSLEPCCHQGRTPPCTGALIAAGVRRVVAAMIDPNPLVAGRGLHTLAAAGIRIESGLLEAEARALNPGFCKRLSEGLPYVRLKLGTSLDGRVAMASGESRWITSVAARRDVHGLRSRSSVVMTGIDTVLADDPAFTARDDQDRALARQPLRVVIDSRLRIPPTAKLLNEPGQTLIIAAAQAEANSINDRVELAYLPSADGRVDLRAALQELARRGANEVLVEAGPKLSGALVQARLVDEVILYLAPRLLGHEARAGFEFSGLHRLGDAVEWRITARLP